MQLKKLLFLNEIFSMFKCFIWSDIPSDTSRLGRGQNNRPQFRPVDGLKYFLNMSLKSVMFDILPQPPLKKYFWKF